MPRPSLKAERTEQILAAYERCIAKYGVDGATLQKIAQEAGLARPLVRHHVGNSGDMLDKAIQRFVARSEQDHSDFLQSLPQEGTAKDLVDALFYSERDEIKANDIMIAMAFVVAGQTRPNLKQKMYDWVVDFRAKLLQKLTGYAPKADAATLAVVADGLIGIYFNVESIIPLGQFNGLRDNSYKASLALLRLLED